MSILQDTWLHEENGQVVKPDGETIAEITLDQDCALLLSKAPELWRHLTQAQNQLEMASKALADNRIDEAMLYVNSLWRERKELIDKIAEISEKNEVDNKEEIH